MNTFKKIAVFFLAISSLSIYAQDEPVSIEKKSPKTPEQQATYFTGKVNSVVTLTPEQSTKVYDLTITFIKAKSEAKKNTDPQASKDLVKAAAKERKKALYAVLTKEQIAKWEAWKEEHKDEMKKTGGKYKDDDED